MSDEVQYLGLRLNPDCEWVAVLDCGKGPENWNTASVTQGIGNRMRYSEPVPQALRTAAADLANPHDHGVKMYFEMAQ